MVFQQLVLLGLDQEARDLLEQALEDYHYAASPIRRRNRPWAGQAKKLLKRLAEAGISARISDYAGAYVCNRAYYAALRTIDEEQLRTGCIFIHLPPDEMTFEELGERQSMPLTEQVEAVRLILDCLVCEQQDSRPGRQ